MTFAQVAKRLGWDEGTLTRYLNSTWRMLARRARALEEFFGTDVAAALLQPLPDPER